MILRDLAAACALLTRLPVGRLAAGTDPARSVWAYPVAGGLVGAVGAVAFAVARGIGLTSMLASAWTLAALLIVTGALHEDGLADFADAFAGGRTPERRLAIMRDSRIGNFGALVLLISSAVRILAVAALPTAAAAAALVVSGALGRAAMLVPLLLLRPARADGQGAALEPAPRSTAWVGVALAAAIAFAGVAPRAAAAAILLALLAGLGVAAMARRLIGGYTGDVFGATSVVAECLVLSLLSTGST